MLVINSLFLFNNFLIVPVSAATAPTVAANNTNNITTSSATLRGYISDDGGENCTVWFEYGTTVAYGNTTNTSSSLYERYTGVFDVGSWVAGNVQLGQTFTIGTTSTNESHILDYLELKIKKQGSPADKLYIEIQGVNDSILPNGTIYSTGNLLSSEVPTDYTFTQINMTEYELRKGITYAIILRSPGSTAPNAYLLGGRTAGGYSGGRACDSNNGGVTWDFDGNKDNNFRVYGWEVHGNGSINTTITGLLSGTIYHFRAGINNSHSLTYSADKTFRTCPPDPVTNASWEFDSVTQNLTINWTNGNYSNYTLIRRSATHYPTDPTDGTLVYNNTINGTIDPDIDQAYLYSLWAYNDSWNCYSSPVHLNFTASWLNCYNEQNGSNITCWDIEISNATGTQVYLALCVNNTHIINISDLPRGENVIFTFSADGYQTRSYVLDVDYVVNLDAYLPPEQDLNVHYSSSSVTNPDNDVTVTLNCDPDTIVAVEGYNESYYGHWFWIAESNYTVTDNIVTVNSSVLDANTSVVRVTYYCDDDVLDYLIHVINSIGTPINEAKIIVKRLIDDEYEIVLSMLTDGNGDVTMYLIPNVHYKVIVNKTGYENETADYTPSISVRVKTYRIDYITPTIVIYEFWDLIMFNATMYANNTIRIMYNDFDENTTLAVFTVFETYNNTRTYIGINSTVLNTDVLWVNIINSSRQHMVVCNLTHVRLGTVSQTIIVLPLRTGIADITTINTIITNILGDLDLGYVQLFFLFFPFIGILGLSAVGERKHVGGGLIAGSLYLGWSSSVIFGTNLVYVPVLIAIGFILTIVKGGIVDL